MLWRDSCPLRRRSVSYQQRLSGGELDRYQELLAVLVRIEQRLDVLER
jgi:hypothetical protein